MATMVKSADKDEEDIEHLSDRLNRFSSIQINLLQKNNVNTKREFIVILLVILNGANKIFIADLKAIC